MSVKKRGSRWYFDFQHKGKRYREAIPLATTKWLAQEAESAVNHEVFKGTYRAPQLGNQFLSEFVEETYLPWAKANKRTWSEDKRISKVLIEKFRGKTLREISPLEIEKLKRDRRNAITKRGTLRAFSSVNYER